jgi:hypothetical protein
MEAGYYWATNNEGKREIIELAIGFASEKLSAYRPGMMKGHKLTEFRDFDGPLTDPRTPATAGDERKDG